MSPMTLAFLFWFSVASHRPFHRRKCEILFGDLHTGLIYCSHCLELKAHCGGIFHSKGQLDLFLLQKTHILFSCCSPRYYSLFYQVIEYLQIFESVNLDGQRFSK